MMNKFTMAVAVLALGAGGMIGCQGHNDTQQDETMSRQPPPPPLSPTMRPDASPGNPEYGKPAQSGQMSSQGSPGTTPPVQPGEPGTPPATPGTNAPGQMNRTPSTVTPTGNEPVMPPPSTQP